MGLSVESSGGNGIFINKVVIKGLEVNPNKEESQYPKDIDFIFTLEKSYKDGEETKSFETKLFMGVNLVKKGKNAGNLTQNISNLFYACNIQNEKEAEGIVNDFEKNICSKRLVDFFAGKTIRTFEFITDKTYTNKAGEEKPKYKLWMGNTHNFRKVNTWDVEVDDEIVLDAFMEKFEKDLSYPPNYHPELVGQSDSSDDGGDQLPGGNQEEEELPI